MNNFRFLYLCSSAFICGSLLTAALSAPPKVQFSKQVLPLLNSECLACHRGSAAPGGFSIESAERLLAGGRHGKAVVAGKSADSSLVKYLTGELKPQMPPGKPLPLDTVALIRRWIDEGAKIDSMVAPVEKGGIMRDAMPMKGGPLPAVGSGAAPHGALLPSAVSQSAPVTAVAFSPDGKWLAAGGYRAVRLLDPATGEVKQKLDGPADQVLALAWSEDGKRLAAAGGVGGTNGEVCLWDAAAWGKPKVLKDHADTIVALAWRPGTAEFATASPDKTARIWDADSGKVVRVLKDHVDAVFGVAYSPDGKWLATGSADRTAKLYQTSDRARVASYINPDPVSSIAFSAKSDLLAVSCEKQVRVWPVKVGGAENPLRGHGEGEPITAVTFSKDGSRFAWGATNRRVRIWNGEVSNHQREMGDCPDWIYSVTLSPDGKLVAAGGADGKLYCWNADDGKLQRAVPLGAGAVVASGEVKK